MTDTIPEHVPTGWKGDDNLLGWADIVGQEHAKRVIEVALAGGHSAFLIGQRGSQAEDLAAWGRAHGASEALASLPCPCGWHGDYKNDRCTCEYEDIDAYQTEHFPAEADIWLEMPSIREQDVLAHKQHGTEPWAKAEARILAARERMADPAFQSLAIDAAGESLVGAAVRWLGMSEAQRERVIAVARTIATLYGDAAIQTTHLAEATQYRGRR